MTPWLWWPIRFTPWWGICTLLLLWWSPTMDSIIFPHYQDGWKKLIEVDPLIQLHHKFWVKGEYNKLLNVDLDKGATWVIDSATGTTEDEDNLNIGPECYVHKTGISGFQPPNLWVRREYIRMYKCCMDYFKPENTNKHKSPLLVVTGQPRISTFSKSAISPSLKYTGWKGRAFGSSM